jgi:hypothetical protein
LFVSSTVADFAKRKAAVIETCQTQLEQLMVSVSKSMAELDDKEARLVPAVWQQIAQYEPAGVVNKHDFDQISSTRSQKSRRGG